MIIVIFIITTIIIIINNYYGQDDGAIRIVMTGWLLDIVVAGCVCRSPQPYPPTQTSV